MYNSIKQKVKEILRTKGNKINGMDIVYITDKYQYLNES